MFYQLMFLAVPLALASPHAHGRDARGHQDIARRMAGDVTVHDISKRFGGARWSFYAAGQGACGKVNTAADFIVALNSNQYGGGYPGPQCFKMITMNYNGKSTQAQIMDECPGCPYGGLDLTEGLFAFFDSTDKGLIYGEWFFNDEGGGGQPTTTKQSEPTTTKEEPKTTSTWQAPETTSSWSSSSSSTWSTSSSTSTSSTSSSSFSWSSSSASSSASTSDAPTPTGMVASAEQLVMQMGGYAVAGYLV